MLCPNCNSQTETFTGKNNKNKRVQHFCPVCGEKIHKRSKLCHKCNCIQRRKVERPSKEELQHMIETMNWISIGRKYRMSDNAVRKWAKNYQLI